MILNEPAAQKEAFNLANLLTNVNPYNLIKPKVANGCLLSIVMVNDLAKLSLNLTKPDIHARGMTTNDDILNQEIITSKKLIVGNKFPPAGWWYELDCYRCEPFHIDFRDKYACAGRFIRGRYARR